jgi:glycine/D-amino acid oxidase-like deaminating enzyme
MMAMTDAGRFDVLVIGGGMLGSAIAYGCATRGARTLLLDEGDLAPRAARGNFGLVWSQGKGIGMPAYAAWTAHSLDLWPAFSETMSGSAGQSIGYNRVGGLDFIVGDAEMEERQAKLHRIHNQVGGPARPVHLLDRAALNGLLPRTPLGPLVLGATYCPADGHVNPLLLLRGLHAGFRTAGGVHRPGTRVAAITPGFSVTAEDGAVFCADRVVVAAGLGSMRLAEMVGVVLPIRPVKGQNIVTERLAPMLPLPASAIRQTDEGVVQIGVSTEEGFVEAATSVAVLARMAARAVQVLPPLAGARMVRSWAALRPMTPDGFAAYGESTTMPGAYVAACHSGVTLSAVHAGPLAEGILTGRLPDMAAALNVERFRGGVDVRPH